MSYSQPFLLLGMLIFVLLSGGLLAADVTPLGKTAPQATMAAAGGVESKGRKPVPKQSPRQEGIKVISEILDQAANQPLSIQISLSKQRVYLLVGGKVAVDSPISSGKRKGWTPTGEFMILEKDPDHQSNLYGDFVDKGGKVIRSGVSIKANTAPSGTLFRGASMKFFMRLTQEGVGMHAGYLPGYPASHGCIRLPLEAAKLIYSKVAVTTPVTVTD